MKKKNCYALYDGDKFIDLGTIEHLAKVLNVKVTTIKFYTSPVWRRRHKKEGLIVFRIED